MTGILNLLAGAVSSVVKDTYFNLVSLLLPGNGTNGAQNNTFLDSSSNNFTITRNGNTTQGTFSPFSQTGWSVNLDGTGDYLTVADNAVLDMGSSNFTMEFWTYITGTLGTYQALVSKRATTGTYGGISLYVTSSRTLNLQATLNGSTWGVDITTTSTVTLNEWAHIAVVRNGNVWTVYINGTSGASTTVSGTVPDNASAFTIGAGAADGGHNMVASYISNFRLVKGTALYTANFTPSTSALTTTSQGATATEVELLTCQSNRFIDNSDNAFTITVNGNPSVQAFSQFAPTAAYSAATVGGSGFFDGTGDYLNVASNTALTFGTGDFTVEGWFYANALGGQPTILNNGSDAAGLVITMLSSKIYAYFVGAGNVFGSSGATIVTNTWYHFAWVRSGSTNTFYLNGAVYGATYSSAGNHSSTGGVGIGYSVAGTAFAAWNGYIADVRMVKGTAVYTTTFTPPTAPLTAITNTSLLTNFTNAGITDATAKNDLETVGNAQISTTQSKFGGSSMYFDGTGDNLLTTPTPLLNFGSSDFTIEFWIYPASTSAGSVLYSTSNRTKTDALALVLSGGSLLVYITASGGNAWSLTNASNAGALTTNTWQHVALVRNGSSFKGYINGVLGFTVTSSSAVAAMDGFSIGSNGASADYLNGYIDDMRISRYARYTAAFTPPTTAFPLQ